MGFLEINLKIRVLKITWKLIFFFKLVFENQNFKKDFFKYLDLRMPTIVMMLIMQRTINIQTCLPKQPTRP